MSCINITPLAMRKVGQVWFVKHIPSRRWFALDGALGVLWDALLASESEQEAANKCIHHYRGSEEAAADVPCLIELLADEGLLERGHARRHTDSTAAGRAWSSSGSAIQGELYEAARREGCPLLVEYEMTYRCNLRCAYCYQPNYLKHRRLSELSREEISTMLDDFIASGVLFLVVTGGECTLHRHFRHVVSEARARSMDVTILTNGTALTPDLVDFLAAQVVSEIKVSVYGNTSEEYQGFTGFAAGHARAWEGLERVKDAGIRTIAKVIVTSFHEKTFAETIEILRSRGVETEVSAHVMPAMDGQLFPLQYRVSNRTLETLFNQNALQSGARRSCTAGTTKFRIGPEGLVTSCELERSPLGNVRTHRLREIVAAASRGVVPILIRRGTNLAAQNATRGLPCPALPRLEGGSWDAPATEAARWTRAAEGTERQTPS
jgi:MoaA/NifB/PqqE/SkfB family radical SAM enzyme